MQCSCGYVWPCGLHSTQRTLYRWWCLVRRARAVALGPRGGEFRVCESTVRGLSGSSIAGRSECTAAAAMCGLAACTARRALTNDRWAQRAESPVGRGTSGRSERSRLSVEGLVGSASGVVCWSRDYWAQRAELSAGRGGWWAQRAESSAGRGTDRRSERSRLLVMGLVGATRGAVCWSWDW